MLTEGSERCLRGSAPVGAGGKADHPWGVPAMRVVGLGVQRGRKPSEECGSRVGVAGLAAGTAPPAGHRC